MKGISKIGRMAVLCALCFVFLCLFLTACKPECRHQVDDWTVTKEPTCNAVGAKQGVCTLCGKTVTGPVAETGHDYEVINCLTDKTCRVCGHTTSAENDHKNTHYESIHLSQEGFCNERHPVGRIRYLVCDDCGKVTRPQVVARFACDTEEKTEKYTDENGYAHTVVSWCCEDCGGSLYDDAWTEPRGEGKVRSMRHYLLKKGDKVLVDCVFEQSKADHTHEYGEFYDFYGEDCDDGYLCTQVCIHCGDSMESEGAGHREEAEEIDLFRYTDCGGHAHYEYCAVCGQILKEPDVNLFCMFEETVEETVDDRGNALVRVTRDCVDCGLRMVKSEHYEYESCASQRIIHYVLSRDGRELLSLRVPLEREMFHDYEYDYDAPDRSCEMRLPFDVKAVCRTCGDLYSFTNRGCLYLDETFAVGTCGTTLTQKRCDICDQLAETVINSSCRFERVERTYRDDAGYLHTVTGRACAACGLSELSDKYVIPNHLSERGDHRNISIMENPDTGNEELFIFCSKYGCRKTNFLANRLPAGMTDTLAAYGYLAENLVSCYACGTVLVSPCEMLEIERRSLFLGDVYYNDQTFDISANDTHEWKSETVFTNGSDCAGGWKKTDTCTVCGYVRKMEGTGHEQDWSVQKFVLLGKTCEDGYELCHPCAHCGKGLPADGMVRYFHQFDNEKEPSFVMKGDSCEDGWEEHRVCLVCESDVVTCEGDYHKTVTTDTRVYDTPCGPLTVYEQSCPCGAAESDFTASCTAEPLESYEGREIDGRYVDVRISTCPTCGFREEYAMYTVKDGCREDAWQVWFFYYGDEKVGEKRQVDASFWHSFVYENVALLGDVCEDGVICDEVCTRCGLRETKTVYDHRAHTLVEQADATPYGCCAGSAFGLTACPCGYEVHGYNSFVCPLRVVEESSWEGGVHTQVMECEDCGLTYTSVIEIGTEYDSHTDVIAAADGSVIAEFTYVERHPEPPEDPMN